MWMLNMVCLYSYPATPIKLFPRDHMFIKGDFPQVEILFICITEIPVEYMHRDQTSVFNSLRQRPNRRHFADDIFKCISENENEWISHMISLKFVPKVRINNIPALVQIMAWRRPGDKPLSEPMMVSLLTHICVTRPQWVNSYAPGRCGSNLMV